MKNILSTEEYGNILNNLRFNYDNIEFANWSINEKNKSDWQ